jgi:hypothetical protein
VTLVAGSNFTGDIILSVPKWPGDVQLSGSGIAPELVSLSPGQSRVATLTLATGSSTPTGSFTVRVEARQGPAGAVHATDVSFGLNAPQTDLFSQGTVLFDSDELAKPAMAVQVLDHYFGPLVFHFRSTLPTSSTTPPQGQSLFTEPNENLRSQLLDLFGGIANVALGKEWDVVGLGSNLAFDIRGAIKIIEVPRTLDSTSNQAYTLAFASSGGANLNYVLYDHKSSNPATLFLNASYFINVLPGDSVAMKYVTPLSRLQHTLNAGVVVYIPEKHFYVTAQYRWSSEQQIKPQIIFSVSPAK